MIQRMSSQSSDRFIHELRLQVNPHQQKVLDTRLERARQLYNTCLCESFKRLTLMRESKAYQKGLKLHKKGLKKESKKKFKEAKADSGFQEYRLHAALVSLCSRQWLGHHLDSLTAQKIATRAFRAVEEYAYHKRGKPRFRGKNRFSSVEGKNNASGLRWKDQHIVWPLKKDKTKEDSLVIKPLFDRKDRDGLEAHALSCKTKMVRLVRRSYKGKLIWFAQKENSFGLHN